MIFKRANVVALLALTLTSSAVAASSSDGIVVYNAQHESLTQAWADGFTKETGIKVTIRQGDDTEMATQIVQEGANSPADVFLTENSPGMALVDQAGLFAPIDADTLAQVPEGLKPANGHWIGIAARSTVFVYNKDTGRVHSTQVVLGAALGGGFELTAGPPPGTRVARDPAPTLSDGQRVQESESNER
jgi:spermidine/putrescine-binding protein